MVHIIGQESILRKNQELYRTMMRKAKTQKEYAEHKREFRKKRNKIEVLNNHREV